MKISVHKLIFWLAKELFSRASLPPKFLSHIVIHIHFQVSNINFLFFYILILLYLNGLKTHCQFFSHCQFHCFSSLNFSFFNLNIFLNFLLFFNYSCPHFSLISLPHPALCTSHNQSFPLLSLFMGPLYMFLVKSEFFKKSISWDKISLIIFVCLLIKLACSFFFSRTFILAASPPLINFSPL